MDKLIENRQSERMDHHTMVTLESLEMGVSENNRMVNCSENGLYFMSDQFLEPGVGAFLRIENFPNSQTGSYKCHHVKIKWGRRLKNTSYAYGYGAKYVESYNEQISLETDSDPKKDLRKHPRKHYDKPAIFGFENNTFDGFINNISRGGCFIENREFLNIGQILDLVIPGTKFSKNNMLKVEVVRLSPSGVGVKFKSIINEKPQN